MRPFKKDDIVRLTALRLSDINPSSIARYKWDQQAIVVKVGPNLVAVRHRESVTNSQWHSPSLEFVPEDEIHTSFRSSKEPQTGAPKTCKEAGCTMAQVHSGKHLDICPRT